MGVYATFSCLSTSEVIHWMSINRRKRSDDPVIMSVPQVSWSLYPYLYIVFGNTYHPHTLAKGSLSRRNPHQTHGVHPPGQSSFRLPIAAFLSWIHLRIFPKPQMSSSESLLSARPTQERHLFYRESVTPRRVQRFTALIHRELASWYVLFPSGTSNLIVRQG
jgi:hypothetical protein